MKNNIITSWDEDRGYLAWYEGSNDYTYGIDEEEAIWKLTNNKKTELNINF